MKKRQLKKNIIKGIGENQRLKNDGMRKGELRLVTAGGFKVKRLFSSKRVSEWKRFSEKWLYAKSITKQRKAMGG